MVDEIERGDRLVAGTDSDNFKNLVALYIRRNAGYPPGIVFFFPKGERFLVVISILLLLRK